MLLTLSGFVALANIKNKRTGSTRGVSCSFGVLQGIRTPDLLVRSQTLYPAELAAHFLMLRYYITTESKNQVFFKTFLK